MEKFDPKDEQYKEVADLPPENQEEFMDVKGGGFVSRGAIINTERAEEIAHIEENQRERAEEMMTERETKQSEQREARTEVPNDTLEIEHNGNVFKVRLDFVWPDKPKESYVYFSSDIDEIKDEFSTPFGEDFAENLIAHQERIPISWQEYELCFFGTHRSLSEEEIDAVDIPGAYHGAASKRNFVRYPVLHYSGNKWKLKYKGFSEIKKFNHSRVVSITDRESYENYDLFEMSDRETKERQKEIAEKYLETLTDEEKNILTEIIKGEAEWEFRGQWLRGSYLKNEPEANSKLRKILSGILSKVPSKNRRDAEQKFDDFMTYFSNIEYNKLLNERWKKQKMDTFPWRYKSHETKFRK